jgi:hypothetical protein
MPYPPPLPPEERAKIIADVLRSQNSRKERIAKEIEAGDLYTTYSGEPKSYWHCLATQKPPIPAGRMGQWKAIGDQPSAWEWQDWGRAPATEFEIEQARKAVGDQWTITQTKILERGWTKDDIKQRLGAADKVVETRVGRKIAVWYECRVKEIEDRDPEFREVLQARLGKRKPRRNWAA